MKSSLRKIILWGSALSIYSLLVVAVVAMLFDQETVQLFQTQENPIVGMEKRQGEVPLLKEVSQSPEFSKVLLPLGPDDGLLPGFREVWDEFLRVDSADAEKMNSNGFEGLQAVRDIADFSRHSVAELFLGETPVHVFRRGKSLFLMSNSGKVQVIDCSNFLAPKLSGHLPYQHIQEMEMQGNLAYLLTGFPGTEKYELVVVDVSNPDVPREISRLDMPDQTRDFLISEGQLVVYTNSKGFKGRHFVHLYDLTDDFQLLPLGRSETIPLAEAAQYKDYLLVMGRRSGLEILDFSDRLKPVVAASIDIPDRVGRFTQRGDIVFALGEQNRLYIVDIHDPLHPVVSSIVEEANHFAFLMIVDHAFYYFTQNGYLRVFNTQLSSILSETGISGELVPAKTGEGFLLLSDLQGGVPAAVTEVVTLPGKIQIADQLFWSGLLVILNDDGSVQFFQKGKGAFQELQVSLKLPPNQRWLALSNQRLYVGGDSTISVIAKGELGQVLLSSQAEFPGEKSWDGLVVGKTLCVAAGRDGIICFSVEEPDHLKRAPDWVIPGHVKSQIDVRQLANSGGGRLMAAAGSAGLLSSSIENSGQLRLDGFIDFSDPIHALAVLDDFCLVSTGTDVSVIDLRDRSSLQNLGEIAFRGVTRFAVASPDHWAGYVPEMGWSVVPAPRFVFSDEIERLQVMPPIAESPEPFHKAYRLKLFDDHDVIDVPGIVTLSSRADGRASGAGNGLQ